MVYMWHATCTQGNQGDSQLLVVENQIGNLTPDPSLGHNVCLKHPNGPCKPILDIYVLRIFQWYKKLFNPMNFGPWNHPLKIQESIGTPTPKMKVHLGVWGFISSHLPTLLGAWNVTPGLHSWPAPLQTFALVTSPRLKLQQLDMIPWMSQPHFGAKCENATHTPKSGKMESSGSPKNSEDNLRGQISSPWCVFYING